MKKRRMTLQQKQKVTGLLFISPWLLGFIVFFAYNFVQTIIYSLSKVTLNAGGGYTLEFASFRNYIEAVAENANFNRILTESMGNIVVDVPLIIFFSLFIALILNKKFKGRAAVRAIFFLPVIMAAPAIVSAMSSNLDAIMQGVSSGREQEQTTFGLNATYMLYTFVEFGVPENIVEYLISAVQRVYDIITASGVQILIFLAALQSISHSLYEVAEIEGATKYETFWKITFPMVSPLILTNVVYTIVDLYSQSEVVKLAHETAFTNLDFGLSSAMSLMSSSSVCIILVIVSYAISKKVFYQT